jgi:glycosyltransferase involved in cell wall biosynthesis
VESYPYNAVVVRYKEDQNTKYSFEEHAHIKLHYGDTLDLESFVYELNPVAIVQSGWSDRNYNRVTSRYKKKIATILAMDNPWYGTFKQALLCRLAPVFLHSIFNRIWVTGTSQHDYASRLGYKSQHIKDGLYSADVSKFNASHEGSLNAKRVKYPKNIVYVGRLVEYKQPHILADVFNEINSSNSYNWKLIIAGEGPMKQVIQQKNLPQVEVRDFIDPEMLPDFYGEAGVFCLPSINEHWGVSVHEAAAAGLPLLLSDSIQAGSQFLIHGYNGRAFRTSDRNSFKKNLFAIMNMSDEKLITMSKNSMALSRRVTHDTWSGILNSFITADE